MLINSLIQNYLDVLANGNLSKATVPKKSGEQSGEMAPNFVGERYKTVMCEATGSPGLPCPSLTSVGWNTSQSMSWPKMKLPSLYRYFCVMSKFHVLVILCIFKVPSRIHCKPRLRKPKFCFFHSERYSTRSPLTDTAGRSKLLEHAPWVKGAQVKPRTDLSFHS